MDSVPVKDLDRNVDEDKELFKSYFPDKTEIFHARAPGRINIIGEHIDYCGYTVMPMALKNDIFMTFSFEKGNEIALRNKKKEYEPFNVLKDSFSINEVEPKWFDYFLCGYAGIMDYISEKKLVVESKSIYVLVNGNIPPNAGLSSSSALVVCASIVTMRAYGLDICKSELARICALSEHYIGTQGGGMDQCISLMAQSGKAMLIDFAKPDISVQLIDLPQNAVFVVTNSKEEMNKAASNEFNMRVVECRIAAKMILKLMSPEMSHLRTTRLADTQEHLETDIPNMINMVKNKLKAKYVRSEVMQLLDVNLQDLQDSVLTKNTRDTVVYEIKERALHVLEEAERVEYLRDHVDRMDEYTLGSLMNMSHKSLSEQFKCSTQRMDQLVKTCIEADALGSRLTGAGWGGCVISFVMKESLDKFKQHVAKEFYRCSDLEQLEDVMFETAPSDGACFFK